MRKIDPKQTIFYTIENTIKTYRKFAQKQISTEMSGITVDQMLVLTALEANPDIAQNEMAELLFKDYASITRMVELLVKNDYLTRAINEEDRRKFILNISGKGHSTLKKLKPIILKNRIDALQGVSESEINQMFSTLNKIIENSK
jgi:DNA-binding MarR family transcriptional regulator